MPFDLDTAPPPPEPTPLDRLLAVARRLGDDERAVLALVAERLALGRTVYGQLDIVNDRRDWVHEATEESLDLSIYLTAALLRRRRSGR